MLWLKMKKLLIMERQLACIYSTESFGAVDGWVSVLLSFVGLPYALPVYIIQTHGDGDQQISAATVDDSLDARSPLYGLPGAQR